MASLSEYEGTGFDLIKWQDLALKNESLRQQFMQYFREGYYSQALALITDNVDIDSETVRPEVFNMINISLTYLQNLYYNSVEVVLSEDEQQFQLMINNFINKKEFSATATYVPYNFVVYNQEIYMCLKATTVGILPTNTDYWLLIGLKGEIGATAIDTTLRYKWDYKITYSVKDVVTYDNILYVAKTRNNNSQPDINPEDWEVFMTIPRAKVIVSPTEPLPGALDVGGEWWKIDTIYNMVESNTSSVTADDSSTDVIESISAYGNVSQVQSTGAQLFNNLLIPNKTNGGANAIGNGDGTTTISGTGTLSTILDTRVTLTHEQTMKLIDNGNQKTLTVSVNMVTYPYFILNFYDANGSVINFQNPNLVRTRTIPDSADMNTLYAQFGYYGASGETIIPGIQRVMVNWGDTVLPWEPYTDGQVTPSPDYPSTIRGFGYSSNLSSFDEWYYAITSNSNKGLTRGTAVWDLDLKKITVTATENDCYTVFSSTATNTIYKVPVQPNTTYIFTWEYSGSAGLVYVFRNGISSNSVSTSNTNKKITITTNADTTFLTFRVGVTTAGTSCSYWNLMLYKAGDYASYFPSGEGKGIFKARTSGLQVFDANKIPTKSQGGVTVTNNNDGSFTISGNGTLTKMFKTSYTLSRENVLKIFKADSYTLSEDVKTYPVPGLAIRHISDNSLVLDFGLFGGVTEKTAEITQEMLDDETLFFEIYFYGASGETIIPGTTKPMMNSGTSVLPWQPFSGIPTTAQTLIPSPLYKLNNTTDYLYREGNKWLIMHKVKKVILDGSIEYDVYNPLTLSKEIRPHGEEYYTNGEAGNIFFDRFKVVFNTWNSDKIGIGYGRAGSGTIFIALRIPIDADPNEYMDAHPTTVIFIPSPDQNYSLIEQLEDSEGITELEQLKSFYHTTELTISSQLEPTQIGLEYSADIPLYMQNNFN